MTIKMLRKENFRK